MDNKIYDMLSEIQIMIEMSYQMLSDNCDYLDSFDRDVPPELLECYNKNAFRRNYIAMDYVHKMSELVDEIQKIIDESYRLGNIPL